MITETLDQKLQFRNAALKAAAAAVPITVEEEPSTTMETLDKESRYNGLTIDLFVLLFKLQSAMIIKKLR